jgi:hypothetical protein
MEMKRTTVVWIFRAGAGVCVIASVLYFMGLIPLPVCAALLIVAFPVTILSLFFCWMAGESGGDIPFIGY